MAKEMPESHIFGKPWAQVGRQKTKLSEHEVYEISVPLRGCIKIKMQ